MPKIVLLNPDETKTVIPWTTFREPTLAELQGWVGGYIEAIEIEYEGHRRTALINEAGKLDGLPLNPLATLLYLETHGIDTTPMVTRHGYDFTTAPDVLCGPVVILVDVPLS